MRLTLFLVTMLFSSVAVAGWATGQSSQGNTTGGGQAGAYSRFLAYKDSFLDDGVDPNKYGGAVYLTGFSVQSSFYGTYRYHYKKCYHRVYTPRCDAEEVANITDAYAYEDNKTTFSIDAYPLPKTTDEQCLALNDDYGDEMTMVLDFDPGELTWAGSGSGAGCEFATVPGVSVEVGGKWHVKFEAIGAVEELEGSTDPIEATGPEAPEGGELVSSEDYTLTTDPQTDCQFSHVTFGTETYCYTGTYAPQDVAYPDGSIRVDNPDGSFDIVAPDGTTTEYTADGGIKNPDSAPGTADGESYGDDADGIIGAISSLKKAVNEGFDKLVDKFTEEYDDAADVASVGNAIDTYEQTIENDQTDIAEDFDNEIDGSTAQSVVDMLPSFTGFSCSDIVFSFGERAMTISCDNFTVFRQMFAFLIYCYTAISMVELFFNSSRQKGVA